MYISAEAIWILTGLNVLLLVNVIIVLIIYWHIQFKKELDNERSEQLKEQLTLELSNIKHEDTK